MSLHLILGCMYSGKCYSRGTKILTSEREYKRIEELEVGDKTLGWDGKDKKIIDKSMHVTQTYFIESTYGITYTVSENHKMVLYDKKEKEVVYPLAYKFYKMFESEPDRYKSVVGCIKSGSGNFKNSFQVGLSFSNMNVDKNTIKKYEIMIKENNYKIEKDLLLKHSINKPYHLFGDIKKCNYTIRYDFCKGLLVGLGNDKFVITNKEKHAEELSFILWSVGVKNVIKKIVSVYTPIKYTVLIKSNLPNEDNIYIDICKFSKCGTKKVIGIEVEDNHLILEKCCIGHNSSQLIHEMSKYCGIGEKVFCINSIKDVRNPGNVITTHDNMTIKCCKVDRLTNATIPYNTTVVGIDEAQFFEDLLPFVTDTLKKGMRVVVAGLDGDSNQKKFGNILDLIPLADTYTKKYALCHYCQNGTPGVFTHRIVNDDSQILIGSKNEYVSLCRDCLDSTKIIV